MIVTTNSLEETKLLGEKIAKKFKSSSVKIFLIGDLGSGKTAFAQGFAKGLGITQRIISPSFLIAREYEIPKSSNTFYHFDLYRLSGEIDPFEIGLKEAFDSENFVIVEWADKLKSLTPDVSIYFQRINETSRKISISGKINL